MCAKFYWLWPSGSEKEVENVKSLQTDRERQMDRKTNRQTDGHWTKSDQNSSPRWDKNVNISGCLHC